MDPQYMKDFYNYKRFYDLNKLRLNYIEEDIRNINIELHLINLDIANITQEYLTESNRLNSTINNYSTNYLSDFNSLKNSFDIKLKECKCLRKKITNNINYYDNLLSIETGIINDYAENISKEKFKKLFPTYDAYKECILNM